MQPAHPAAPPPPPLTSTSSSADSCAHPANSAIDPASFSVQVFAQTQPLEGGAPLAPPTPSSNSCRSSELAPASFSVQVFAQTQPLEGGAPFAPPIPSSSSCHSSELAPPSTTNGTDLSGPTIRPSHPYSTPRPGRGSRPSFRGGARGGARPSFRGGARGGVRPSTTSMASLARVLSSQDPLVLAQSRPFEETTSPTTSTPAPTHGLQHPSERTGEAVDTTTLSAAPFGCFLSSINEETVAVKPEDEQSSEDRPPAGPGGLPGEHYGESCRGVSPPLPPHSQAITSLHSPHLSADVPARAPLEESGTSAAHLLTPAADGATEHQREQVAPADGYAQANLQQRPPSPPSLSLEDELHGLTFSSLYSPAVEVFARACASLSSFHEFLIDNLVGPHCERTPSASLHLDLVGELARHLESCGITAADLEPRLPMCITTPFVADRAPSGTSNKYVSQVYRALVRERMPLHQAMTWRQVGRATSTHFLCPMDSNCSGPDGDGNPEQDRAPISDDDYSDSSSDDLSDEDSSDEEDLSGMEEAEPFSEEEAEQVRRATLQQRVSVEELRANSCAQPHYVAGRPT